MSNEFDLQQDEMREIIDDFLVEADELAASLDNNFVKLESSPDDPDLLNEIFRAAHTIKGTSSFLGFEQVTTLTHRMEDILNKLRKGEMRLSSEIMDTLLDSLDILKGLLEKIREGDLSEEDLTDIVGRLNTVLGADDEADEYCPSEPAEEPRTAEPLPEPDEQLLAALAETPESKPDQSGEAAAAPSTPSDDQSGGGKAPVKRKHTDPTIRVDVERLDALMNMVGELVLGRNSLMQSIGKLQEEHEGDYQLETVSQSAVAVNFITTELQMSVMKMRMQPVGKVFNRFPRLVRDLARDAQKQIELEISGESTELDKSVIEEIGDPLVHIIRNSCDHGLELPQERTAKGKPAVGTVQLQASQEGSNIIIKIIDDGRGFDVDAIRSKAVERGLATRSDVDRMSDRDVFKFIFEAGFSTAKKITDVSGRGVGMDVVRSNIEKLNGMVELDSVKDEGTTITIKLPLTLAIIQGLLVQCEEEVFILPLSSVVETVKTDQSDIHYVNKRPVLCLRDEIIPICNLSQMLRRGYDSFTLTELPYIVIVGLAEKKIGLIVDRFLGQEEVVIKSLGSYLGSTEGVAGATILGDGRIRLIVDIVGLFNLAKKLN